MCSAWPPRTRSAGVAAAAAGSQIQALFQQTWIVVLFAGCSCARRLDVGLFTIQMPSACRRGSPMSATSSAPGTFGGVAVMGALSALIVTACVAPPLFAALAVIGQSGDVLRGGSALFVMSLGMGAAADPDRHLGRAGCCRARARGWTP
jgi:thiol:disulfide interchange protein DsbD